MPERGNNLKLIRNYPQRAAELYSAVDGGLSSDSGISRHGLVTPSAKCNSAARFLADVLNAISPTFNHTYPCRQRSARISFAFQVKDIDLATECWDHAPKIFFVSVASVISPRVSELDSRLSLSSQLRPDALAMARSATFSVASTKCEYKFFSSDHVAQAIERSRRRNRSLSAQLVPPGIFGFGPNFIRSRSGK